MVQFHKINFSRGFVMKAEFDGVIVFAGTYDRGEYTTVSEVVSLLNDHLDEFRDTHGIEIEYMSVEDIYDTAG